MTNPSVFPLGGCGATEEVSVVIIPGTSESNLSFAFENGSDCKAKISYQITYTDRINGSVEPPIIEANSAFFLQIANKTLADYKQVTMDYQAQY